MYLERSPKPQAGAGLPLAIFIVTVLSLIVLGMSQLQESSGKAISLQIQSQRAFFAAESGAQVRISSIFEAIDNGEPSCPSSINSFASRGLRGCFVFFECSDYNVNELFTLTSIGTCGDGIDQASRTVEVRLQ